MATQRTGAQIIWECLVHEGVSTVFGYPGGAILPAYDAMLDYPVKHVLVRHEQGASHMADGYARAGGGVGVAMATSGPGATNLVTGIATAMMDSVPMVCITGQVPSKLIGYDAFQETDITGITLPITKHSYLVTRVEDIMPAMKEAFVLAKSGRPGPVLVDITKDAQQAKIDWAWDPSPVKLRGYRPKLTVPQSEMASAVDLLAKSKRPVILAGQGILQSGAMKEVREFAERINAPVAMTLLGLGGFPASHPLHIGMMGMHGESWVNHAIQEADLLIALGMRFDDRVTGNIKTYAVNAKKIHIDIDPSEINKNVQADAAIVADLREALKDLLDVVKPAESRAVADVHRLDEGDVRGSRHSGASRQRPPVRTACHQRHLAYHRGQSDHRDRRGPAPDVGGAVPTITSFLARSSHRAVLERWVSDCRQRSAPRWPAPMPRCGRSLATAVSR